MVYSLNFKLDVKKDIYISKKAVSAEPFYQISANISINKIKIHYFTGYSAQKIAWFNSAESANKGDGNRTFGIHRGYYAKKGVRTVQYAEANRALDIIAATMLSLSTKSDKINKESIIKALNEALGKKPRKKNINTTAEGSQPDLGQFWTLANLYCRDAIVSDGRNKSRVNAMNHLRRFEQYRGEEITFPSCNARLLSEFNAFMNSDIGENDPTTHPRHRARKKNHNTICKVMACVKQFFRWCYKQYGVKDFGNIEDYSVPTPRYGDPIALTEEEMSILWNMKFEDEGLEYVRDLFYFQCCIGCRVSDFFNLKYKNLIDEGGKMCIHYCPRKTSDITGIECRIPLISKALAIFKKWEVEEATPQTPLFYFPKHAQVYNRQLKRVFKAAGLNRQVVTFDSNNQIVVKPLYDIAMSKLARSYFIDVLVGKSVTDEIISTMSGHIPGSKAFHRYHNRKKARQQDEAMALLE